MAGGDTYDNAEEPSWNVMTICTVGGVLFFNVITRQLETYAHGNKQTKELLESVYRELSVLGIVAFVLWSIGESKYLNLAYNNKHQFEAIHMTLFLAAVFHSFFVVLVSLYSRQVSKRWDVYEDDEMKMYKELKQQHRRTAQALGLRHSTLKRGVGPLRQICMWIRHPSLTRRLYQLSENVSYHALRAHFIKTNQLPKNFRFSGYLKKCEQEVVIELAEIKESVWVGFILAVGIELYIKGIMGEAESSDDVRVLFLVSSAVVFVSALGVHFKLGKIYNALLYSYTTGTDRKEDFMQFLAPDLLRQQDMFWFGKPDMMLIMLQSMQFLLAIMVALLIWFGTGESPGLLIVGEIVLGVGALAIYTIVLPRFIPAFTMVTHVGEMVDRHILSETLTKQTKAFRRRTLPPTLRQVTMLARMKVKEPKEVRGIAARARTFFAGHLFREIMIVFLSIHFFIVAYNTDPVESGNGLGDAYLSECVFAGVGVVVEILTHFISWNGKTCCGSPFYGVPSSPVAASSVYPSIHKSQRQKEADESIKVQPALDDSNFLRRSHGRNPVKRCSIWACFGGGGDRSHGGHGCVPHDAAAGFWRSVDVLLVFAVAGATIATGLTTGTDRVIAHSLQGLVLLRLAPLHWCPLPPKPGTSHMHDLDGVAMDHHPLSKREREEVMEETRKLLRGQDEMVIHRGQDGHDDTHDYHSGGARDDSAGKHQQAPDDGSKVDAIVVASAVVPRQHENGVDMSDLTKDKLPHGMGEEKEEHEHAMRARVRQLAGSGEDADIAKVGVAIALREACTAYPDIVTTHGPLSAHILRAMLGLDPTQAGRRDNQEAFAIAAGAVSLKGTPGDANRQLGMASITSGAGFGMGDVRGPSPPASPQSSSASSEYSESEESGRRRSSAAGIRTGRLPSWLGGGRGSSTMDRVGAASHHSSVGRGPPIGQFGDVDELMESSERVMEAGWIGMDGTSRSPGHDHGTRDNIARNESYLGPLISRSAHSRVTGQRSMVSPHSWSVGGRLPAMIESGMVGSGGKVGTTSRHSSSSRNGKGAGSPSHDGGVEMSRHKLTTRVEFVNHPVLGPRSRSRHRSGSGVMAASKEDMAQPKLSSFANTANTTWDGVGVPTASYHRPQQQTMQGASSARHTPRNGLSRGTTPNRTPGRSARASGTEFPAASQAEEPLVLAGRTASDMGSATTANSVAVTSVPSVNSNYSTDGGDGRDVSAE